MSASKSSQAAGRGAGNIPHPKTGGIRKIDIEIGVNACKCRVTATLPPNKPPTNKQTSAHTLAVAFGTAGVLHAIDTISLSHPT